MDEGKAISKNNVIGYLVDIDGYIIETYVVDLNDEKRDGRLITESPQIGTSFYRMMWTGTEWVEGETAEEETERVELAQIEALKPSQQELSDADLEIKVLTLLMEMEVI